MLLLKIIFFFNILISSIFMIISKNPVYSVLYLIFLILNCAGVLILLNAEFLALLLVIIYVGAIAVLFLFVVMMLDIKSLELHNNVYKFLPFFFFLIQFFLFNFIFMFNKFFPVFINNNELINSNFLFYMKNLYLDYSTFYKQVQHLSFVLYLDYYFLFLCIAIILLFSMIGVIIITLNKNIYLKRQDLYTQINKNVQDTIYLIQENNLNYTYSFWRIKKLHP